MHDKLGYILKDMRKGDHDIGTTKYIDCHVYYILLEKTWVNEKIITKVCFC